jgi:hypothetical protein
MVDVVISEESARGCGYRKPAKDGVGVYLVGPSEGVGCGRLPFKLHACPVCGGGIRASRGWNWIEPSKLFVMPEDGRLPSAPCQLGRRICESCPLGLGIPEGRHGLLWIGESFYKTPDDFSKESNRMGVSRKIKTVPKGFEIGKTWVYLAHRLTPVGPFDAEKGEVPKEPAIFSTFKPTGIDLVIADENKVPDRAVKLAEEHGARIVRVVPKVPPAAEPEQHNLPMVPG